MSDTPGNEREPGRGEEPGEYRDPTAPSYESGSDSAASSSGEPAEGAREVTWSTGDESTQAVSSEGTQQFPAPPGAPGTTGETSGPDYGQRGAASPYGQPPSPYGQSPYGQAGGAPQGSYGQGQGPYGQGQSPYGQGQSPYGQGPGQVPSPYAAGQPGGRPASVPGQGYPYGQQPGYAGSQPYGYGQSPYGAPRRTNSSAIVLLIVSGLSTLFGFCITAIPALVLAIVALVKQDDAPADSAKYTRWGWIAYAIGVALYVIAIIGIIAVVATTSPTMGY